MIPEWLSGFLDGISAWQLIVALTAIIGFVVWVVKKKPWSGLVAFAKAIIQGAQILDSVKGLPSFIEKTNDRVDRLIQQTENHHDTNLRDDVSEAIKTIKEVAESVADLHAKTDERFTKVDERLDELAAADDELREDFDNTLNPMEET